MTLTLMTSTLMTTATRDFDRRYYIEELRAAKRNKCAEMAGQCFSTSHCCDGLVCVSIDDYFGEKPEVPGSCVKEKDLQECRTTADCGRGARCTALGRTADQRYCTPAGGATRGAELSRHAPPMSSKSAVDLSKGSLGSSCETTAECRAVTNDGEDGLCCKDVHRARLGVRRQCDRVHSMGACIGPRH